MNRLICCAIAELAVLVVGTAVAVCVKAPAHTEAKAAAAARPVPAPTTSRKIDEYGNITFEDEKARLDVLAVELRRDPDAIGYLSCYGGRVGVRGEASRRCARARNHLVRHAGLAPSRVVTLDGGFRERLTVELWVLPSAVEPPGAYPTVDPKEVRFVRATIKRRPKRR